MSEKDKVSVIKPLKDITNVRDLIHEGMQKILNGELTSEQGHALAELAQMQINSAKVEAQFMTITGGGGTGFIPVKDKPDSGKQIKDKEE